ncbi:antitoxin Xre/MbcA/ParS toxin-binding domain-containing protein [Jatrophihabitans sp.]|uniref:antitoxin Xre/MbcA/ParS toxin-binding domain-containing protein n=1 Tax=Jatrophihabitans sp. TaxID=1932789 RepID=UPI002CA14F88|nr:antitoxin Xre/MbcA/ParS toxin-binding domain-containing protein [Jatrophihabitans sp.]
MTHAASTPRSNEGPTYPRIVEEVTDSGVTQAELGQAVGASLRTVQNWASGATAPAGVRAQRLLDIQYIVRELRVTYTDEGVRIWLHSRNRNLGRRRPIDLLTAGDVETVLEEAEHIARSGSPQL